MPTIPAEHRDGVSAPDLAPDRIWRRRTCWLIGGFLLFRLVYAALVPLDLISDEAYYWDWSRQLDWGYYSKPPMVAWLIALSTSVFGSTALAVRLPAVLLGTLGLAWMYLLAARLYGRRAGFWAALLTAATPGNAALALLMTIDAPFLFCWCGTLYCFWRFLDGGRAQVFWLAAATLLTGLGLLSKQTMIAFFPLAFVFLALSPTDRGRLRAPGIWVWAVGSLLFLLPVLFWNMQHDWITAQHTSEHFTSPAAGMARRLARFGEFLGGVFGGGTPVTMFLYAAVLALTALGFRRVDRRARYLFCFSGLPMAGVLGLALVQRVHPNWPAGFVPAGLVLVCGWALGQVGGIRPLSAGALGLRRAAVVGAACVLVAYLLPFGLGLEGSRMDPAVRLRGWEALGKKVDPHWRGLPPSQEAFLISTLGRTEASELAFYLPAQPRAYVWNPTGRIMSQYDIWGGPPGNTGATSLIVTSPGEPPPRDLAAAFQSLEEVGLVHVPIGNGRSHRYQLWRGLGFSAWPTGLHAAESDCPLAKSAAPADLSKKMGPHRCDGEGQVTRMGEQQPPSPQWCSDSGEQRPFRTGLGSAAPCTDATDDLQPASQASARDQLRKLNDCAWTLYQRSRVLLGLVTAKVLDTDRSKPLAKQPPPVLDLTTDDEPKEALIPRCERPQQRVSQENKPGGNRMSASLVKKWGRKDHDDQTNVLVEMVTTRRQESRELVLFSRTGRTTPRRGAFLRCGRSASTRVSRIGSTSSGSPQSIGSKSQSSRRCPQRGAWFTTRRP